MVNDLFYEFQKNNIQIVDKEEMSKFIDSATNDYKMIATIENDRLVVCDNTTGNKWTEEFNITDYKYALDWYLNESSYMEYLDFYKQLEDKKAYTVAIYETSYDYDNKEYFEYPIIFKYLSDAINTAKEVVSNNNYAGVEVIGPNNKIYWNSKETDKSTEEEISR